MNWERGLPALLACLTGVAALGACDSHSSPTAVRTGNASGVSTPEPRRPPPMNTSSPTTSVNAVASGSVRTFAIQTVNNFFQAMNQEIDTGNEAAVSSLFDPACSLCVDGVVRIKGFLDGGNHVRGLHLHLLSVDQVVEGQGSIVTVIVNGSEDAGQQLDANGKVVREFTAVPSGKLSFHVDVHHAPPIIVQLARLNS